MGAQWKTINENYKKLEGYKRVAWPPVSQERIVREFTPQPQGQPAQAAPSNHNSYQQPAAEHYQQQHHQQYQQQQQPGGAYGGPQQQQGPIYNNVSSSPQTAKPQHSHPYLDQHDQQEQRHQEPKQYIQAQYNRQPSREPAIVPQNHYQQECRQPPTSGAASQHQQQPSQYGGYNGAQYPPRPQHQQQHETPQYGGAPADRAGWKPINPPTAKQQYQYKCPSGGNIDAYGPPATSPQPPHQQQYPYQQQPAQQQQPQYRAPSYDQYQQPHPQQQPATAPYQQQYPPSAPSHWGAPQQQQQYSPQAPAQQQYQQPQSYYQQPPPQAQPPYQYQNPQSPSSYTNPNQSHYQQQQPQQQPQYNSYSQPQQQQQHQQHYPTSQDQIDRQQSVPHDYRGGSPGIIQLRKEAPLTQKPAPVYTSQPAAVSYKGGSNMRGDLKWPPPEYKEAAARENEERRKLALGPVCRPRKVHRDYTSFFAKNAINSYYPSYKVPPGTQHMLA